MALAAPTSLLEALRYYRLLEPSQLDELDHKTRGKNLDGRALAQKLIENGWLTPYQANQLLQGRGQDLVLGPYKVLERLGEGGMGQVFKARHAMMDRVVAIKLIHKERLGNPDAVRRFHREVEAAAKLRHPNIVHALDAGQDGDRHFLVMEYVPGTDLNKLVKEKGPLPIDLACDYIRQVAAGLAHAHDSGLVHRDVKPHNLLLTQPGGTAPGKAVVKILDFGLARVQQADEDSSTLTKEGAVMGSVDYVAPEQAMNSHTVDVRADLYSLGCTFYQLLTGKVPFPGGTAMEKLTKHAWQEPVPVEQVRPDVPPGVAAVVRKLMAKKPADRFQLPADVAAVLANGAPNLATAISVSPSITRGPDGIRSPAADRSGGRAPAGDAVATPILHRSPRRFAKKRLLAPIAAGALLLGLIVLLLSFTLRSGGPSDSKQAVKGTTPRPPQPGEQITNSLGMKFAYIPAGKFKMGSSAEEIERVRKEPNRGYWFEGTEKDEMPQHEVRLTRGYYLGVYEVTQGQYDKVTGKNPSFYSPAGKGKAEIMGVETSLLPVESVLWEDARDFCQMLTSLPEEKRAGRVYRLPTEAEWEYACRAGTTTLFHYGYTLSARQANIDVEHPFGPMVKMPRVGKTVKVGSYQPNSWGLYDMHGNVWEWCLDCPRPYTVNLVDDPRGPARDSHVMRGGGWREGACRSASRKDRGQGYRGNYLGFRVLCER